MMNFYYKDGTIYGHGTVKVENPKTVMPYTPPIDYTPTIEEIFTYIPPSIPEQQQKHTNINNTAKIFAIVVERDIANSEYKKQILLLIQQAALLSHQALTIDYLGYPKP